MRAFVVVVAAACGSPAPVARPATPVPIANQVRTCTEAAVGLEHATKDVRAPDTTIVQPMRLRCTADNWPTVAIDCFATMADGDLGRCAAKLSDHARVAMFDVVGGGDDNLTTIAVARSQLETLQVGVDECDRFIAAVRGVLACERLPIDERAQLGRETIDFWSLPAHLPDDAHRRMAEACGASLASLQQHATGAGCTP